MRIQVAIVSDQLLPNLIPALMQRPDKIHLACSGPMCERALDRRLARLLRREAIDVEIVPGVPDAGIAEILRFAFDLAQRIADEHPDAEIVFNATGGTKLMTLAFVEAFRALGARILYTDTAHRRIEWLPEGPDAEPQTDDMKDVLDVPRYLDAQGFRFSGAVSDDPDWRERAAARKAACKYLGRQAERIQDFIGAINGLADQALDGGEALVEPRQVFNGVPWGKWQETLGELTRHGLLRWRDGSADIEFVDDESARFLHGGWLEEYAWHVLKDDGAFDVRLGVRGRWDTGDRAENEFDVLATQANQLLFIECKTLRHLERNDNTLAYKVDSLGTDARGLFGATWILAAREPSTVLHERARQARFRVLGPGELPRLREHVLAWMRGGG